MKAAGIICEFNPFHNGHKYLIDNVRQAVKPDAVVCVMSGDFVQRGELSLWDKYSRAEMAVLGGADLVVELPVCFALNAAKEFAGGGIAVLKKLGFITDIAFGSECGNIYSLQAVAEATADENKEFSRIVKQYMDSGISYPAAYQSALKETFSGLQDDFFSQPNNILGLEYLKANINQNAGFNAYTIPRNTSSHDSMMPYYQFASGKYIRDLILEDGNITNNYDLYVPEAIRALISDRINPQEASAKVLFELIRYKLISSDEKELAEILEVTEGLEYKLKKEVITAENLEDLIFKVKSKRYTYARISRILMQILLGIKKSDFENRPEISSLRVLAFNNKGRELIKQAEDVSGLKMYTNISKNDIKEDGDYYLKLGVRATDIYSIINSKNIYANNDLVCNSIYCNI